MKEFFKNKVVIAGIILLALSIIMFLFGNLNKVCSSIGLLTFSAFCADIAAWFIIKSKNISENKVEDYVPLDKKELNQERTSRAFRKTDCIVCAVTFIAFALVLFYYGIISMA